MIKKTIKFTDYDGVEREEDFYFNLSKAEVMELQLGTAGTLTNLIERIMAEKDVPKIIEIFKKLIIKSYGKKSLDGRRFIKNDEVLAEFTQCEAYSELFMELSMNAEAAVAFINGIIPQDLLDNIPEETVKAIEEKAKGVSE